MAEDYIRIPYNQISSIRPDDLDSINAIQTHYYIRKADGEDKFEWVAGTGGVSNIEDLGDVNFASGTPTDGQVLTYDSGSGKWVAEDSTGGISASDVDDFTIKYVNNKIKIADRIELNIMLNAFRIAVNGSLSQFAMTDGIVDEFEDETGVDTVNSTGESYDSADDYYKPSTGDELDYMEYANNTDAQTAYVTDAGAVYGSDIVPTMTSDTAPSGESSASSVFNATTTPAWKAFDDDDGTRWLANAVTGWLKYDFGVSNEKTIVRYTLRTVGTANRSPKNWTFEGSNTGNFSGEETVLDTQTGETYIAGTITTYSFSNSTVYRFYRINITLNNGDASYCGIQEMEMIEASYDLQCYSESSIKEQGSYSLKSIAKITDSLNDTLTKSGLSIDLSGLDTLKFKVYASRTGTNLQMQIHDSGGTTSTKDIVISSANTWETTTWDISGIADANKDNIDSIIIKIINANAENTFYIDDFITESQNIILISNSFTAEAVPSDARIVLFEQDVDAITINTDLKAYVSRDGGTTFTQATLSDEGDYESGKRILSGLADISGQPSNTSMEWKVTSHNSKALKLHCLGLHWD